MMNLTKILKKTPLQSGVYVVRGEQGVGKTSFVTALMNADYKLHRKWRSEQGRSLARQVYADSGVRLHISDRLYFSNNKILLDKKKQLYTHWIDVQRLGLPNDDYAVQYLPRGSVVFIQEADLQLFCRDYEDLNAYLIALLKFVRHNLITLIFDCQTDGMLDKVVRRLATVIFHIESSYQKRFWLFWKPFTWRFIYIRNQLNEVLKDLAAVGVKTNLSVVKRGHFRYFKNVFERFNSFSGVKYFLRGIEKVGYEYLSHPDEDYSMDSIKQYCQMHPLTKPQETKKSRRRR